MAQKKTMVKQYDTHAAYQKDANKLAQQGWKVQNVTEQEQRSGLTRCCLLGLFALVLKPRNKILVTYVKE